MKLQLLAGWIIVAQMPLLKTSISENHQPGHSEFVIDGRPQFQNLVWITYGALLAILTALGLSIMAVGLNISQQAMLWRAVFAGAMIGGPLLAWVLGSLLLGRLSQRVIEKHSHKHRQQVTLSLNVEAGTFTVQHWQAENDQSRTRQLNLSDIQRLQLTTVHQSNDPEYARVMPASLVAETSAGEVMLLPKALGSREQKEELKRELNLLRAQTKA